MCKTMMSSNPYIEAMPKILGIEEYFKQVASIPQFTDGLRSTSAEERRGFLAQLNTFFYPMEYMYYVYDLLYKAMIENYSSKTVVDTIRQINRLRGNVDEFDSMQNFSTSSYSGAILRVPGIEKSSTIKRSLSVIPQVITHTEFNGAPMYRQQIPYLMVECPSDCSVKTLALNIMSQIDKAVGSTFFEDMVSRNRTASASTLAIKVKIACLNHRVGLIVIDEIQNAVLTAERTNQTRNLIKFLIELTNEACVSICFVGTLLAEKIFMSQEHLKRRTRGYRLLPMKFDKTYTEFISMLWGCQVLRERSEITEGILKCIYDYSAGIPAYIVKLFTEAQTQALLTGRERLSIASVKRAVAMLNISVDKTFLGGMSISDFAGGAGHTPMRITEQASAAASENGTDDGQIYSKPTQTVAAHKTDKPQSFRSVKRGRPVVKRDERDLVSLFKELEDSDLVKKRISEMRLLEMEVG